MYNRAHSKLRTLTATAAAAIFVIIYLALFTLFPFLRGPSQFHRHLIGGYLLFFMPMNLISWFCFGQFGGILVLLASCLSIIIPVLKYGVLYYNGYIFLFGISALLGYRLFLRVMLARNQLLARTEELEAQENNLILQISKREQEKTNASERLERYASLKGLLEELSATLGLKEIAALIVERTFGIIGKSDRAFLFIIDEKRQGIDLLYSKQVHSSACTDAKNAQDIINAWLLRQRRPLLIEDMGNDFRFSAEALKDPKDREFKSSIGAPLISEQKVIGLLRMDARPKAAYAQDDLRLLDIISDIAAVSIENTWLYQKTNELAITDGLTGLYVQRFFKERLADALKTAQAKKERFSILMLDLDYFKECNDRYGHAAGDIMLIKIAQLLKAVLGPDNVISRYGGEEFAVILLETDRAGAIEVSEEIRERVERYVFALRRDRVKMTVSIGVSSFPEDGCMAQVLLKKADENLYKAKDGGRNRVCYLR